MSGKVLLFAGYAYVAFCLTFWIAYLTLAEDAEPIREKAERFAGKVKIGLAALLAILLVFACLPVLVSAGWLARKARALRTNR